MGKVCKTDTRNRYNYSMSERSHLSDEALVVVVRSGESEAYAELIARYQGKLLRYATYLVHDEEQSADIVQESFIKAYINLHSFNAKLKFSSWIYRIVHNEAMSVIQKGRRFFAMGEQIDFDSGVDIEAEFDREAIRRLATGCVLELPLLYKEPIALFYLDEKSYEEISDILRIPIGTVGTRINRGKSLLKKICQKNNH